MLLTAAVYQSRTAVFTAREGGGGGGGGSGGGGGAHRDIRYI